MAARGIGLSPLNGEFAVVVMAVSTRRVVSAGARVPDLRGVADDVAPDAGAVAVIAASRLRASPHPRQPPAAATD